ncbi:MAG: hypothetical protein ACOH5I_03125 [Oligoflexus sp.]
MKLISQSLAFLIFSCAMISCGFDELPEKKETTTYEDTSGADGKPVQDPDKKDSTLAHEVTLSIAERKTQSHFCEDFVTLDDCEVEWQTYLEEDLVFRDFDFHLTLSLNENERITDVSCGFRSPDGSYFAGEFSQEHGLCFAFYDDYTGASGLYDLFPVEESNIIPGNLVLFMFDSASMHIVDSDTLVSFSHEYKTGLQQYKTQ